MYRRDSDTSSLHLSSNNPFRNRTSSPGLPSPGVRPLGLPSPGLASPGIRSPGLPSPHGVRPVSRNPFLAAFEQENAVFGATARLEPNQNSMPPDENQKFSMEFSRTEEAFGNLRLINTNSTQGSSMSKHGENRDADSFKTRSSPHKPDVERPRVGLQGPFLRRFPTKEGDLIPSSRKSDNRRPRRNSESSVVDKKPTPDEERKNRERGAKDRDAKSRDGFPRDHRAVRPRKPRGLDLIDKLDVTGIYGAGLFHHDGPFDACNPHRNRKKDHRAPMHAFPADSANNAIGGSGPLNKTIDINQFHGRGAEGFSDYGSGMDNPTLRKKVVKAT